MHSNVQISNLLYCHRICDGDRGSKTFSHTTHTIYTSISCSASRACWPILAAFDILDSTSILDTYDYIIETQIYYYYYYNIVDDKVHGNII